MYEKEVVDQTAKIEKMKAEKKDEYDIKKQVWTHWITVKHFSFITLQNVTQNSQCAHQNLIFAINLLKLL